VDAVQALLEKEKVRTEGKYLRHNSLKLNRVRWNLYLFSCSALKKAVVDETVAKDALQVAFTSTQEEYEALERAAVATCQELEGEGGPSGSSVASRLRSLGGRVTEHLKGTLPLGIQKALGVVSTQYIIDLEQVATGYVIAPDADEDAAVPAMEQAYVATKGAASALSVVFEVDLFPDAKGDAAEGPHDGEGNL